MFFIKASSFKLLLGIYVCYYIILFISCLILFRNNSNIQEACMDDQPQLGRSPFLCCQCVFSFLLQNSVTLPFQTFSYLRLLLLVALQNRRHRTNYFEVEAVLGSSPVIHCRANTERHRITWYKDGVKLVSSKFAVQ